MSYFQYRLPGKVRFTVDAWSSRVYRGYMVISVHLIDHCCNLHSTLLDFVRFPTPHTGEAAAEIISGRLQLLESLPKTLQTSARA